MWHFNIRCLSMCSTKQNCSVHVPGTLLFCSAHTDTVIFQVAKCLIKAIAVFCFRKDAVLLSFTQVEIWRNSGDLLGLWMLSNSEKLHFTTVTGKLLCKPALMFLCFICAELRGTYYYKRKRNICKKHTFWIFV